MLIDLIILFIIIVIICFILTVFLMLDYPIIALPFITVGMLLSVVLTYGMWRIDFFYTSYNATHGNCSAEIYSTFNYGEPYSYIFFLLFWVFVALFVFCGFQYWRQIINKEGQVNKKTGGFEDE